MFFFFASKAKLLLRKKKFQENLLEKTDGQLDNIERMVCYTYTYYFIDYFAVITFSLTQYLLAFWKRNPHACTNVRFHDFETIQN